MPDLPARAAQLGALALLLRPTYIATEVVTAAATTGGSARLSDNKGATARIRIPAAQIPTIGVPAANSVRT